MRPIQSQAHCPLQWGGTNMISFQSVVPQRIITITPIAWNSKTNFKHMHERTLMYAHVFLVGPNDTYRRGALTRLILRQRLVSIAMLSIMPILHLHLHAPICRLFSGFLCCSLLLNSFHEFCVHFLKSLHGLGYVQEKLFGCKSVGRLVASSARPVVWLSEGMLQLFGSAL